MLEVLKKPRMWLIIWGAIGSLALIYVIIAASVSPNEKSQPISAQNRDTSLLTGEMADFTYAFPPRRAPTIPFLHEGEMITLQAFRGKTILVNFWATFCTPCLAELPSLDALEGEFGGKNFQVVAIASDPRGADVAGEFLTRLKIENLKLYADPQLVFSSAIGGVDVLPVSILFGADGVEIGRITGEADWQSPEASRLIQASINAR